MDRSDLDEIARRPQKYWTADGLPELVMGGLWMLWGSAWLLGERLPETWASVYRMFVPAILAFTGVLSIHLVKRLKAKYTFPRRGYVEWRQPTRAGQLGVAAVAIVVAAVLAAAVLRGDTGGGRLAPAVLGVILSLAFLASSVRQRAPHLLALAGVAITLGLAVGTIAEGWTAVNWLFIAMGAATALAGGLRFAHFLGRYPPATAEGA